MEPPLPHWDLVCPPLPWPRAGGRRDACPPLRLLSPRPSLLTPTGDTRAHASPQKPLDLKQLKQRAAAIPPIVSAGPPPAPARPQPAAPLTSWAGKPSAKCSPDVHLRPPRLSLLWPRPLPGAVPVEMGREQLRVGLWDPGSRLRAPPLSSRPVPSEALGAPWLSLQSPLPSPLRVTRPWESRKSLPP